MNEKLNLKKRFQVYLEESGLTLEDVWSKLFPDFNDKPSINLILTLFGYSMGIKDEFYNRLDEVGLGELKQFCDSLSREELYSIIKGD